MVFPIAANAQLTIEPVFNRIEGTGPGEASVGTRFIVNHEQERLGLGPLWTAIPNEIFSYVSGDPRNPGLDGLAFFNDTDYNITGFGLEIIGTGTDTDDPGTIVRGAPIDAMFGDVDGDGQILSDIFANHTISADGRRIDFTDGLIQPGERYSGIHLASSPNTPEFAGIDSWITGTIADSALCATQGDPVAQSPYNLVDAYCIDPMFGIGAPGEASSVTSAGVFPANADGVLDLFVIWEPSEIDVADGEAFTYSSQLTWGSDKPDAVLKEWAGNFNGDPVTYMITNTADSDPAELVRTDSSFAINERTFDASQFPGAVGRYHVQISGLEPGELVTFRKLGTGGHVVPEPNQFGATLCGLTGLLLLRRRNRLDR
ncbi:MAG: hypothetical protein KDA87_26515 [Planctomycetales bacterium]|nr:hypothetical protein [Planctomycetales bacterium]